MWSLWVGVRRAGFRAGRGKTARSEERKECWVMYGLCEEEWRDGGGCRWRRWHRMGGDNLRIVSANADNFPAVSFD